MSVVILLLLIATEISETLTKVLTGQFSDNAIWVVIGYQVPILLREILPASFFLACLTSLHRISQDSERAVIHAIGISDAQVLTRLMLLAALPILIFQLSLNHFIAPLSQERLEAFVAAQKSRPITDIIEASSFYSIPRLGATFYAEESDSKDQSLNDVFSIQKDNSGISLISANSTKTENIEQFQVFEFRRGKQTNFTLTTASGVEVRSFDSLEIILEDDYSAKPWQRRNAVTTPKLLESDKRSDKMAIIDRFSTSLYIPLFCIWAVALTRFKPRSARIGAMAFGIVLYVLTSFSYRTINGAIGKSDISLIFTPWWFFVLLGAFAVWLIRKPIS